ncbi:hypothetical protein [Priestia megaterium]|uniref:hypothetical protein n=1 Tax=Priestia megaterium TaxID=1404 RepID=UPI001ABEF0E3|nr:hypothetical protein [Priestia megaterium]
MREIISTEIEKGVIIKLSDGTIIKGAKRNCPVNKCKDKCLKLCEKMNKIWFYGGN